MYLTKQRSGVRVVHIVEMSFLSSGTQIKFRIEQFDWASGERTMNYDPLQRGMGRAAVMGLCSNKAAGKAMQYVRGETRDGLKAESGRLVCQFFGD